MNSEWREVKLGELCDIVMGQSPKGENCNNTGSGTPLLNGPTEFGLFHPHAIQYTTEVKKQSMKGDLLFCVRGSTTGRMNWADKEYAIGRGLATIRHKRGTEYNHFVKGLIDYKLDEILNSATGSTFPNVGKNLLNSLIVYIPPLSEQKSIADTLSCLDDKIELNNRINKTLEEMAQAIFKSWFVDFEPFQDGEFEDSELGRIPKGWRVGVLDDIIEIFDSKRIPLSSRKRENMQKIYPYYGATSLMDYVDDYIFEGIYVLLGEDGTVVDANGYPILQYVWGKFWVNNHAHILKGQNGFNEDSIYMMLKNISVQGIVTGAVQLKINQANLKSVKVIIPAHDDITKFNHLLEPLFAEKRRVVEENQMLTEIRDTLLPKLMSGEIRVPLEEVQ